MLRLKQLITATPLAVHHRGSRCIARIKSAEVFVDENGSFKFMQGHVVDPPAPGPWKNSRGPYSVIAKLYMDVNKVKNYDPKTFIWCDCDFFKFNCETALALKGSSAIINSNGQLPKITNPTGKPMVCKHCIAFLRRCRERKQFFTSKNPQALVDSRIATEVTKATPPPVMQSTIREKIPGAIKTNTPKTVKTDFARRVALKKASKSPAKPLTTKSTSTSVSKPAKPKITLRGHR